MANPIQESNSFYAKDLAAWHKWLAENHNLKEFVWLILFKKNLKTPCITLQDAIDEALCFGWIDSKPNKRDAESYYLFFAQRKPKSVWSKINKEKVKRLLAEGRIQKAGLRKIEQAKKDGSWDILNEIEELIMPEDLKTALDKNRKANEYFEAFP
ncbi:MAG: YdeI/OmpD-associated family protein, partial [Chryseotalea sp.]